jgi:1-acyl-sn-glycerol-3-phosphate acyltransferase
MLISAHIEGTPREVPKFGLGAGIAKCVSMTTATAARLITGAEVRWIGSAPSGAQRIYIANHTSHADFILLWAALPPCVRANTRPVAAADYWTRGILRRLLIEHVFDGVLIDRGRADHAHNPLAPMLRALDSGGSLIIFPEGTRGCGDQLLDFKCGIYHLARERPDVELVPVWIENLHRVLPRGAILPVPLLCSVTFGEPTHLARQEDKKTFLARLRQSVIDLSGLCEHC